MTHEAPVLQLVLAEHLGDFQHVACDVRRADEPPDTPLAADPRLTALAEQLRPRMEQAHGVVARVEQLVSLLRSPDRPFRVAIEAPRHRRREPRPARVEPEQVERWADDIPDVLSQASHELGAGASGPAWVEEDGASVVLLVRRRLHADGDGGRGSVRRVIIEGQQQPGALLPGVAGHPCEFSLRLQLPYITRQNRMFRAVRGKCHSLHTSRNQHLFQGRSHLPPAEGDRPHGDRNSD